MHKYVMMIELGNQRVTEQLSRQSYGFGVEIRGGVLYSNFDLSPT